MLNQQSCAILELRRGSSEPVQHRSPVARMIVQNRQHILNGLTRMDTQYSTAEAAHCATTATNTLRCTS